MKLSSGRLFVILVLTAALALAASRTLPPAALPADAQQDQFSAERAFRHVQVIASEPRLVGSPAYDRAVDYLVSQLAALGLSTQVQNVSLKGMKVENVLGRLEGAGSRDAILLSAHIDSLSNTPGATDDASGVAAILETLRALRAGPPLQNTILVLFSGPEEDCCYGAQAFASQNPWAGDVRLVMNLDSGGIAGPSILAATGPQSGWLIREFARTAPYPVGSSAVEALGSPKTDYTLMLRKVGYSGYDFNLSWNQRIHSSLDTPENLHLNSLQHQGYHLLAMARRFGDLPLEDPKEPRPVYFDLLGLVLLYYPVSWVIPIMLAVGLVLMCVIILGVKRRYLSLPGISFGTLPVLFSLASAPMLVMVIWAALFHSVPKEYLPSGNDFIVLDFARWGSAFLAMAVTLAWHALLPRVKKVRPAELLAGSWVLFFLALVGTTFAFPAISYFFAWPLLCSLLAGAFWFSSVNEPGRLALPQFLSLLVAAVLVILFQVPVLLIALLGIGHESVDMAVIFIVLSLSFFVPLILAADQYPFNKNFIIAAPNGTIQPGWPFPHRCL